MVEKLCPDNLGYDVVDAADPRRLLSHGVVLWRRHWRRLRSQTPTARGNERYTLLTCDAPADTRLEMILAAPPLHVLHIRKLLFG